MQRSFSMILIVVALGMGCKQAAEESVSSPQIIRLENFPSSLVEPRNIDVWLPANYDSTQKYRVMYMHDGQMLFDSTTTWNKQEWKADETAQRIIDEGKVDPFIIVGIWNPGENRHANYFPQAPYDELLSQAEKDTVLRQLQQAGGKEKSFQPVSDNYLSFIIDELKPEIDKRFSVYTEREHTFIAGSSMGALISLYALTELPQIFGGAACLSTHWPGTFSSENNPVPQAFFDYFEEELPDPGLHRIYFDYGDQTLDAMYPPLQAQMDSVMIRRGYSNIYWQTRFFPGTDHSEKSWAERLEIPFVFLMRKEKE